MTLKLKLREFLQETNRIAFFNRKQPSIALEQTLAAVENFINSTGLSREELLDRLQTALEANPEQPDLFTAVEMLKQYE